MNLLEIIILGIVEGLTEYLSVSSTGHLLLTESLLNMSQSKEALDALAVCIQGGAILAVLSLYFPRQYTKYRNGQLGSDLRTVILDRIGDVLDDYAAACFPALYE